MKRIKGINGYTIFQAGPRDVSKRGFTAGSFYVYFSSDVRDFGLLNSTPEFEDCGSIEEAEAHCTGNFAIAKEIVEGRTTAAGMEEILEVEAQLDAGMDPEEIEAAEDLALAEEEQTIEEARQLAHEHGLPFSSRPFRGAEDDLDPYTYDGSMTPEDYELMMQRRQAHQALADVVAERLPGMAPETLGKLVAAAADLHVSPEQLDRIISAFEDIAEAVKKIVARLLEVFRPLAEWAAKVCRQIVEAAMHAYAPPKWWHYYKHAKKRRIRKKYEHRIRDSMLAAIRAAQREEGKQCRDCSILAPFADPI